MIDWGGKVAAWFTGASAGSAGLATLIATVAKPPLHGALQDIFIAFVVIAVGAFILLLFAGLSALLAAWRERGTPEVQDLAQRAAALSAELFEFAGERARDDPGRDPPSFATPDDEQFRREWREHTRRTGAHTVETINRYDARFRVRALQSLKCRGLSIGVV